MRILVWFIFVALLAAFQGSIMNPVVVGGIRPDFILITVYYLGILKGEVRGGLIGAALGFLLDITSAGPVYSNIFSKSFAGYLAGTIGRWVHNPGALLHMVLIFIVSLVQGIVIFFILIFLGTVKFPGDLLYIAIPQAIFDGILGGAAYLLLSYRKKYTQHSTLNT